MTCLAVGLFPTTHLFRLDHAAGDTFSPTGQSFAIAARTFPILFRYPRAGYVASIPFWVLATFFAVFCTVVGPTLVQNPEKGEFCELSRTL